MLRCLGRLHALLLVILLISTTSLLYAHDYPHLVKVKVGEETTFRVSDAATCSATVWIDNIENESLFSITPNQADGISVEFTIQANETPGETVITIQWTGEDVGSDEGSCTEDTRDFGGVQITVRVTSDKVNSVGDDATAEAGDGHCDTGNNIEIDGEDVPECTLRAAIEEVNAGGWESKIEFDIPGSAPHLINPESALPPIEKQTVVTGFGVGSAKVNQVQNRVPTIILDGKSNDNPSNGIVLNPGASGTLIEGLSLIGFGGHGIVILADEVILKSNYIGTDPGGSINQGNEKSGVFINEGVGNQIGGDSPDDRNIISGNFEHGVEINSGSLNRVIGNWIGLKPDSSGVLGNLEAGVKISEGSNHAVGAFTDTPGMAPGNVISGNKDGLFIDSNEIFVRGNVIGDTQIDPEAEKMFANTNSGITVEGNTITIGGTDETAANMIAGNGGTGVFVDKILTEAVSIRGNSIFNNELLGIDLADLGVTENDSLDADQGPNNRINYPVIDSVVTPDPYPDGAIVSVYGKLNSTPNSSFFVDVYMSDGCDASKYGEGQIYLGVAALATDAMGNGTFHMTFTSTGDKRYDGSKSITTTTTDGNGNTSEFSACSRATILLVDLTQLPIKEKTFAYFKVMNNPPIFTETFVDSVTTNEDGIIYKDSLNADGGDKIIFRRKMTSQAREKNIKTTQTSYSIFLDNIKIKDGGEHEIFELDDKIQNQKTTVAHTVIGFNLAISIEWWASRAYVNDMVNSLMLGSNYLYNVSDGQMKLDTVVIVNDKVYWDDVDVRYHATNLQWPEAIVDGISKSAE
ncbi:MAG TPA: hypothetical protein DCE78_10930, partial [Bacteroidetes bacterium]|nr:hypothetical protein [Bacteroidota bacterium]